VMEESKRHVATSACLCRAQMTKLGLGEIIMEVVRDTTLITFLSFPFTTRHDRFFYLPTKDLAPFSIHIPTKTLVLH